MFFSLQNVGKQHRWWGSWSICRSFEEAPQSYQPQVRIYKKRLNKLWNQTHWLNEGIFSLFQPLSKRHHVWRREEDRWSSERKLCPQDILVSSFASASVPVEAFSVIMKVCALLQVGAERAGWWCSSTSVWADPGKHGFEPPLVRKHSGVTSWEVTQRWRNSPVLFVSLQVNQQQVHCERDQTVLWGFDSQHSSEGDLVRIGLLLSVTLRAFLFL